MKAKSILNSRSTLAENVMMQRVIWQVPSNVEGSTHHYKYRLALVIDDVCVMRYDNEAGKGDHKHIGDAEFDYQFVDLPTLLKDFQADVQKLLGQQ